MDNLKKATLILAGLLLNSTADAVSFIKDGSYSFEEALLDEFAVAMKIRNEPVVERLIGIQACGWIDINRANMKGFITLIS